MHWLERAYTEHKTAVFATAYGVLRDADAAEDIVQDVFLRLGRDRGFDASRGGLGQYVRLLARSRALDHHRSARAAERTRERWQRAEPRQQDHPEPGEVVITAGENSRVRAAVAALPAKQREAIALAYWGDLSTAEVAAHTASPLGTAKSRVRLGLSRLRADMAVATG
jgi:RNA polymerase sigma-70 factor, ECF subfamily